MSAFIEKIKVSNFLSFLGEYEINLKPFTAIMCNFFEGKDDLCRTFEFVFGATLADLRVDNPLDLVHKVLRDEFLVNREIHTFVEITLGQVQEKKQLKLSRSVINGVNSPRIEHKVAGLVTSSLLYEEKLHSLGIFTRQKNLIFYKSYFNNVIWGSAEDLESIICTCLRESYMLENWKKTSKEVEYLKKLKNRAAEKHYNSMKTSHSVLAKYSKKYETVRKSRESTVKEILLDFTNDSSSESNSVIDSGKDDERPNDSEFNEKEIFKLETNINSLTKKLDELKLKEAFLNSCLYHEEIKLASKPVNASVLQNRISHIKTLIREKENLISEIWKEIQTVQSDLDTINGKIPFMLIAVQDIQNKKDRQNRFTQYGKFCDYLQPSRYIHLLKHIIGVDIFNAHLCDSLEEAFFFLEQLNEFKYEQREVFLPFEHYSHKLKDVIIASGEKGVQINTLEELLIFLCKLKHYQVIDEVPVIVQKEFNFENITTEEFTVYVQNSIFFTSEGLLSCKTDENDFLMETESELHENLKQLYIEEEINYRKLDDLLFMKWEALTNLNSLENDMICLKQKWRKSTQKPPAIRESSPIMQIYEEFHDIFKEYDKNREEYERELQQEEEPFFEESSSTSSNEEYLSFVMKNLEDIVMEKTKTERKLQDLTQELRRLNAVTSLFSAYDSNPARNLFIFKNGLDKTKLFFEKEFRKLKNLIREDDLEDFLGSEEWRKTFISSLIKDFDIIKNKLKTASEEFVNISTARKTKLYQLFDHCSRYLSNTFRHILNDALPFVKIDFGFGEEKIHMVSCLGEDKINVVDIKHFNTFLKFISALALFLEIAVFEKTPIMIMEDIEEYFPIQSDNLEAVMELSCLEEILPDNQNPRFSLLMRLGQFLRYYVKKNTPGKFVRNNGNNTGHANGPMQLIYFAKEDLVHAADHLIWIQCQILPEECITENCNSYSEIHEINFEKED